MTKELKQEYTLRISQANRSQLVIIIYEMLLNYLDEAKMHIDNAEEAEFHESIRYATGCIRELTNSINYESEAARNILSLNIFCIKQLAKSDLHCTKEELDSVTLIISKLYEAYKESVKSDKSEPVMANSQQVYAGLTYGKESLIVNLNSAGNRGYTI